MYVWYVGAESRKQMYFISETVRVNDEEKCILIYKYINKKLLSIARGEGRAKN